MRKIKTLVAAGIAAASMSYAGPGLADGAAKFVGNITTGGQVRSDFGQYWNQITAENECKWQSIEGSRGNYNFSGCDRAYNWAKQNGGHFKFHALVWGSQYPSWLNGLSADETKKAITNWMDAVKQHYPDLEMIDVVNEAIRTGNNSYHSPYGQNNNIIPALGGDNNGNYQFVVTAFKMARERWPNAILIYNDYNTVQWNKDQGIDLINKIKAAGAPVDAYGLQAHDMMSQGGGAGGTGGGGSCLSINTLKSVIEEIWQKTQMPMFISEYDIASADDRVQKQCYEEQISYFMENEHIAGITLWGYIYGQTWVSGGTSGIIKDGQDRAAMTWLKEYLSKNKGVNTTGLAGGEPAEPVPREPFKGAPLEIPGKIEMEDFDIPGVGSGNISYSDADMENHGDSDYRKDTGVDLYNKGTGVVVGYNSEGDWLEYTVNVKEAGEYTMFAAVAAAGNTSNFTLSLDGKTLTDRISVPANSGEENYDDYSKVNYNVELPAGEHILRLTVTGAWFDIDYITFVKGANATDPEPIEPDPVDQPVVEPDPTIGIAQNLNMNTGRASDYDVFTMQGQSVGRVSAYSISDAISYVKNGSKTLAKGTYFLLDRSTGKMQVFKIAK